MKIILILCQICFTNMCKMNNICRIVIVVACFIYASMVSSQNINVDGTTMKWEASFDSGLNTDGYEVNFGVAYFPVSFIGLKTAIGFSGEIVRVEDWDIDWDDDYIRPNLNNCNYAIRFRFNPSVVIRSPRIIHWKSQDAGFYFFGEPGFILSPGASGSHKAQILCWNIRAGINMQIDRFILGIGYGLSNFSLYSGEPYNENGLPSDIEHRTHSGFLTAAIKF